MIETEVMVGGGLRIAVAKDELVGALGVVARAVSTRTSVQILSGILLEAQNGELRLAATDMELSLRTMVEAKIESEGPVVVPGRLLLDIARLLPETEVSLEHRLEEAVVSYDRAIALRPGFAEAFNNRGNALQELKRSEQALASSEARFRSLVDLFWYGIAGATVIALAIGALVGWMIHRQNAQLADEIA